VLKALFASFKKCSAQTWVVGGITIDADMFW